MENDELECGICLQKTDHGSGVLSPCCVQLFHLPCLKEWLEEKKKCPFCQKAFASVNDAISVLRVMSRLNPLPITTSRSSSSSSSPSSSSFSSSSSSSSSSSYTPPSYSPTALFFAQDLYSFKVHEHNSSDDLGESQIFLSVVTGPFCGQLISIHRDAPIDILKALIARKFELSFSALKMIVCFGGVPKKPTLDSNAKVNSLTCNGLLGRHHYNPVNIRVFEDISISAIHIQKPDGTKFLLATNGETTFKDLRIQASKAAGLLEEWTLLKLNEKYVEPNSMLSLRVCNVREDTVFLLEEVKHTGAVTIYVSGMSKGMVVHADRTDTVRDLKLNLMTQTGRGWDTMDLNFGGKTFSRQGDHLPLNELNVFDEVFAKLLFPLRGG